MLAVTGHLIAAGSQLPWYLVSDSATQPTKTMKAKGGSYRRQNRRFCATNIKSPEEVTICFVLSNATNAIFGT